MLLCGLTDKDLRRICRSQYEHPGSAIGYGPEMCLSHGYLLSMRWFSLEEERVMQQSSVSISLSFWEPRYQCSRRPHANRLVPAQTIMNLATNAIKGLRIPSRALAKVRSGKDNKINIFGIFIV